MLVPQGGKKGKSAGEGLVQWDCEREMVLQALVQLLQLDIRSLWNLSLVEEEFIRYSPEFSAEAQIARLICLHLLSVISFLMSVPSANNIVALLQSKE